MGKTLIVTGASAGTGRPLARGLTERGVKLVLNARTKCLPKEAAVECSEKGRSPAVRTVRGKAAEARVAQRRVRTAGSIGHFYGFIHAAAVFAPGFFLWELPEDRFGEVLESNVVAVYQLARFCVPEHRRKHAGFTGLGRKGGCFEHFGRRLSGCFA